MSAGAALPLMLAAAPGSAMGMTAPRGRIHPLKLAQAAGVIRSNAPVMVTERMPFQAAFTERLLKDARQGIRLFKDGAIMILLVSVEDRGIRIRL